MIYSNFGTFSLPSNFIEYEKSGKFWKHAGNLQENTHAELQFR